MKRVAVVIREAPLSTVRTGEALRMALGMTLSDHQVDVLYCDAGAYAALPLRPELVGQPSIVQSIELFQDMKVREWVEQEALEASARVLIRPGVASVDRKQVLALIGQADVVIVF